MSTMKTFPEGLTHVRSTREFDADTVPAGLLKRHTTRADTWGRIVVTEGEITYRILEPEVEETVLDAKRVGVIEPGVPHELELRGPVRFQVEFWRGEETATG